MAAGQGILPKSRMHVLCPQIHKNCEYQRKIIATTIPFLVGKICNYSDQKTSENICLINFRSHFRDTLKTLLHSHKYAHQLGYYPYENYNQILPRHIHEVILLLSFES